MAVGEVALDAGVVYLAQFDFGEGGYMVCEVLEQAYGD